jgi:hypothetical protein
MLVDNYFVKTSSKTSDNIHLPDVYCRLMIEGLGRRHQSVVRESKFEDYGEDEGGTDEHQKQWDCNIWFQKDQ